jgi:hypothetical protein
MPLTQEQIKEYLDKNLFDELNLDEVSDEARFAILSKLADIVYIRFVNELTNLLSDDDNDALEVMLSKGAVDEFEKFLNEKVPNNQEILLNIIAEEKKNLLEAIRG